MVVTVTSLMCSKPVPRVCFLDREETRCYMERWVPRAKSSVVPMHAVYCYGRAVTAVTDATCSGSLLVFDSNRDSMRNPSLFVVGRRDGEFRFMTALWADHTGTAQKIRRFHDAREFVRALGTETRRRR